MPAPRDFRRSSFSQLRVERCGKYIGRYTYWKLYEIENTLRVFIHSVLSVQINSNWWSAAADRKLQEKATRVRADYARRPWHTPAGPHDIYHVFLPDISKIIRTHNHLFDRVVPDIDKWVVRIDDIRLPRNLVGHMNFLSLSDRQRIDALHRDIGVLITQIQAYGLSVRIP